jgi:hypothetical protein
MRLITFHTALALSLLAVTTLAAQQPNETRQELAVTVGEISGTNPGATAGTLSLGNGIAVQGNYARKIRDWNWGSFYWEVNGLYNPLRYVSGTPTSATHKIWSLYATPGVKLQFTPQERISPYILGGGGYALYGEDQTSINGGVAGVKGHTNRGAVELGGGFDFVVGKSYLLRADVRGFYTGGPNFGVNTPGGQFNFVISGGMVFRFPK